MTTRQILYITVLIFVISTKLTYGQAPSNNLLARVPANGKYLLYKNNSYIISYYWQETAKDKNACPTVVMVPNRITLHIVVKNLTSDSLLVDYTIRTYEKEPLIIKYEFDPDFSYIKPRDLYECPEESNCGSVVDFRFETFTLKSIMTKMTVNLTKEINRELDVIGRDIID